MGEQGLTERLPLTPTQEACGEMNKVLRKIVSPQVEEFAHDVVDRAGIIDDSTDEIIRRAYACVPRDRFVEENQRALALTDRPLPIGFGLMSEAPSFEARILGLLELEPGDKVLEIGCGSGYLLAVLASAGMNAFGIECRGLLAQRTRKTLDSLWYHNVLVNLGDGFLGWREHAPYDAIVFSGGVEAIPRKLFAQLNKTKGILVAPVGTIDNQQLMVFNQRRGKDDPIRLEPTSVPMLQTIPHS